MRLGSSSRGPVARKIELFPSTGYLLLATGYLSMKHQSYMQEALKEAKKSLKTDDIPIGAVAVLDGKIIARAHNEKEKRNDSTAHAELLCLQKAAKKLKTWRLNDVIIYTTLEPCSMCAGAMVLARIKTLVYGTSDFKAGAAGSILNIARNKKLNHKIKIAKGILKVECSDLLKAFFKLLRQ